MSVILNLIKTIMTLRAALSGYKTYLAAFATVCIALAGGINEVILPWINGDLGSISLFSALAPYLKTITMAFGLAGLRAAK